MAPVMCKLNFFFTSLLAASSLAAVSSANIISSRTNKAPYLEPAAQAFAKAFAEGPPLQSLPPPEARKALENLQATGLPPLDEVDFVKINVPVPDTKPGSVEVHIFKPKGTPHDKVLPTLVYYHGGGWILGSPVTHRRLAFDLIKRTGYAVYFVYFTPSPESQFPQPITESYTAYKYLLDHGAELGLSSEKVALVGDSAGGQLSAAVTMTSLEKKTPLPKQLVMFYPVTDLSCESSTYREFFNGPGLNVPLIRWMRDAFVPNKKDRKNPLVSPLLADSKVLAKFPKTLIITAESDLLREEGERFAEKLGKAGVEVGVMRVLQTLHDFVMVNALAKSQPVLLAIDAAASALKATLG